MIASLLALAVLAAGGSDAGDWSPSRDPVVHEQSFQVASATEVLATVGAACGCSWGTPGREAAVLAVWVDGRYSQHLLLLRGARGEYRLALGRLEAGPHRLTLALDRAWTPAAVGTPTVERVEVAPVDSDQRVALALAPILYFRPNTVGRFTDAPLLMWYELLPRPGGSRLRYSVVFTNEDGGTPIDRLMATWGRSTDIEFVYEADVDSQGQLVADRFQAPEHEVKPFAGPREGRHPVLWVSTDNNMVDDHGAIGPRFALAAVPFDLADRSREAVMDVQAWTYRLMAEEAVREGKVAEDARPGSGRIPDPRRFAYLEGCGETQDAAIAFDVAVRRGDGLSWSASDGGRCEFRIARSGCFRGAVALPAGAPVADVAALRVRAHTRLPHKDEPPLAPGTGEMRLDRLRLFFLGADYAPRPAALTWTGPVRLRAEGAPIELPVPAPPP